MINIYFPDNCNEDEKIIASFLLDIRKKNKNRYATDILKNDIVTMALIKSKCITFSKETSITNKLNTFKIPKEYDRHLVYYEFLPDLYSLNIIRSNDLNIYKMLQEFDTPIKAYSVFMVNLLDVLGVTPTILDIVINIERVLGKDIKHEETKNLLISLENEIVRLLYNFNTIMLRRTHIMEKINCKEVESKWIYSDLSELYSIFYDIIKTYKDYGKDEVL